jgi:hypothetical protein
MCKEKPNEMDRVGYLGISAFWAVLTNLHVRQQYKTSSLAVIPANMFAFVQALAVLIV